MLRVFGHYEVAWQWLAFLEGDNLASRRTLGLGDDGGVGESDQVLWNLNRL